jgi:hypothetical protein
MLAGLVVGGILAAFLSGLRLFGPYTPWQWNALAAGLALSIGSAGALLCRGMWIRLLMLTLPAALALLGSFICLESEARNPLDATWYATSAALAGAAAGLLSGFATRRLGGYVAGLIGGQMGAWPATWIFTVLARCGVPFGLFIPLAFALTAALTHLAILGALRLVKADQPPEQRGTPGAG